MSKFAPWDESEAKAAMTEAFLKEVDEASRCCEDCRTKLVNADWYFDIGFFAGVEWAAAQIDKCPSLYRNASHFRELWDIRRNTEDTHEAKLVGVREVNHE